MGLPIDDCDDCVPEHLRHETKALVAAAFSSLPFIVTVILVGLLAYHHGFALLSGTTKTLLSSGSGIGKNPTATFKPARARKGYVAENIPRYTFAFTIALATVLIEVILGEVSNTLNTQARKSWLRFTILLLLVLLVLIIPCIELYAIIRAGGWRYTGKAAGRFKMAWALHLVAFGLWITGFWCSGPSMLRRGSEELGMLRSIVNASTEHVGVIGISLLALLSGFASISAPWQAFGVRQSPVSETAIARKEAGLEATRDMLAAKKSRLRALEHKAPPTPSTGFLQKTMNTFRSNPDVIEKKSLEMEISGLSNMETSLEASLAIHKGRMQQQRRSSTTSGLMLLFASYAFAIYCIYRVFTTLYSAARRQISSLDTSSDPVGSTLSLLVKHYDSHLDQEMWLRQISFLLSGAMLLASFSSVLQTFHFFARFTPGVLRAAQANLPLIVAQLCATYVISVTLLLRNVMPGKIMTDGLRSLGGDDMAWVDAWFETWFLGGALLTVVGIGIAKHIGDDGDWDDDGLEMGKMN